VVHAGKRTTAYRVSPQRGPRRRLGRIAGAPSKAAHKQDSPAQASSATPVRSEAFQLIGQRIGRIVADHGPDAVAAISWLARPFHFTGAPVNQLTAGWTDEVTGCPEHKVTAVRLRATHGGDG
jgi:hypothetical protein